MKRVVSTILLVILLTSMLYSAFKIMPAGLGSAMRVVASIQNSWNISTNLVRGELYHSHIQQGLDWSLGYFEEDERYPGFEILYVEANITDPQNNQTIFVITMGKASGFLAILDINLTSNGGGLDATPFYGNISNSYYEVGGIAQFDGNYTFQFHTFPDRNDPPVSIQIINDLIWTTIYIRADGTIDPPDANISMVNSCTYVFDNNVSGDLVVEKDNVVIDGGGHTLQAAFASYGNGIGLNGNNVTIKNTNIENFELGIKLIGFNNSIFWNNIINNSNCGIWLEYSSSGNIISGNNITNNGIGILLDSSSNNIVSGNNIANNWHGIFLSRSSNNCIAQNNLTANDWFGMRIEASSSNNSITENTITDGSIGDARAAISLLSSSYCNVARNSLERNSKGLYFTYADDNTVVENEIVGNLEGFSITSCSNNFIIHNSFIDNTKYFILNSTNLWIASYPSGGNYWSDYTGIDQKSGSYQNETGSDKMGDTPYVIDVNNTDRYPLIYPFGYVPSPDFNNDGIIDIFDLVRMALAFGSVPGMPNWDPYVDLNQDGIIDIFDLVVVALRFGETV